LQGPGRGRMGGDVEVDQASAAVLNNHEYIQQAKRQSRRTFVISVDYCTAKATLTSRDLGVSR
jgi:hypothetical protein